MKSFYFQRGICLYSDGTSIHVAHEHLSSLVLILCQFLIFFMITLVIIIEIEIIIKRVPYAQWNSCLYIDFALAITE